jgi:uncharacterized membrane protein
MRNLVMRLLICALTLAGLTVSALALHVHNMDPSQAPPCAVNEHWDCGAVNHSRFSYFPPRGFDEPATSTAFHVPVATIGIIGYAIMFLFAAFGRWWVVLQLAEIGFGAACFLSYLEAFVIDKWCIYCVWSQAIVAAIVVSTIFALILRKRSGHRLDVPQHAAEREFQKA